MGVYRRPDSKYWWLWLETSGRRLRTAFPIGTTAAARKESREHAEEAYHSEMLKLGQAKHGLHVEKPSITFTLFADWYDAHVIAHHRGAAREREILKGLRATFGQTPLSDITRSHVLEWRTARAKATSAATSNRELDVLKQLLTSAVPTYLDASPIAKLKRLRSPRRETRVLSPAEERRLLKALKPADRVLVICALDTLMRLSDVVNLRRDQDRGRYLLVVDPKIEPYRVPVSTRLRAALDSLKKDGPYYFGHRRQAKKARDFRSAIKSMLKRACKKAKIPYGRKTGGLTFHGLRHTGTTRMVDAGVSLRIVQDIGGWKSIRQLERYAHPTERAKLVAVNTIASRSTPASSATAKKTERNA